jgi:hypothetical protein
MHISDIHILMYFTNMKLFIAIINLLVDFKIKFPCLSIVSVL